MQLEVQSRFRIQQTFLLILAMVIAGYTRTGLSPIQEAVKTDVGLSDYHMSVLQGPAVGIPLILLSLPLGLLIDRAKRIRILQALVAFNLIGGLLTAIAPSFWTLVVARAIAGVTALSILPVTLAIAADYYEAEKRGRAATMLLVGQVIGNTIAFAFGGALLELVGVGPSGWRTAMLWMCLPVVPGLLAMVALAEPPQHNQENNHPSLRDVYYKLRSYRRVILPIAIGIIFVETALVAELIWALPMLARLFTLPPDQAGGLMAVVMLLSGIVGPLTGGWIADYCQKTGGVRKSMSIISGFLLFTIPTGFFAFFNSISFVSTFLLINMTFLSALAVMGIAVFTIVVPDDVRGLCMNLLIASISLFGLVAAPPLVTAVSELLGGEAMIGSALSIFSVTCCAFGLVAFVVGVSLFQRSSVPTPSVAPQP